MKPNSREKTPCGICGKPIFFAVTRNDELQALDAEPDPVKGSVAAYRGVRRWLARSLLAADAVQHPPHPLEERFTPHGQTCPGRISAQPVIPGLVVESTIHRPPQPQNVIPFRRRRT